MRKSSKRDWQRTAEVARRRLDRAPKDGREAELRKAAEAAGVKRQTLRTYLIAARFLRSLPIALSERASEMPAFALETAARWQAHDRKGAMEALGRYLDGRYSSARAFARDEAQNRSVEKFAPSRRQSRNYPAVVRSRLDALRPVWPHDPPIFDLRGGDVVEEPLLPEPTGMADFLVTPRGLRGEPVAVVVARPTPRHGVREWTLWALGIAAYGWRVALVVPGDDALEFAEFLSASRTESVQLFADA
jgi:hypothetical protein